MIKQSSIFLVVCFFSTALSIEANFYWRNYDGKIPSDAILGGNLNDTKTYIGLISAMPGKDEIDQFYTPDMVSALIIPGDLTAYATYRGGVAVNDKGVKILCTDEPQRFVWTKQLGANCVYVMGSHTSNLKTFYIGRASYEGNVVTGRVSLVFNALYIPWLGPPLKHVIIRNFETLAYC